jgi:hypothetical protein
MEHARGMGREFGEKLFDRPIAPTTSAENDANCRSEEFTGCNHSKSCVDTTVPFRNKPSSSPP